MRRFIGLNAVLVLIALSGCAAPEPIWIIPGDLGTTQQRAGKLPDAANAKIARIRIRVTGMVPPSPNSGSRELYLTLACTGPAATQARWHDEPVESEAPGRSRDFACGEGTTIYFTHEHPERRVVVELPDGVSSGLDYVLTASVHAPY